MKCSIFVAAAILCTGVHAQVPCSACPGGINVDADTETENGNVCGDIQSDAARFDADDKICDRIKGFEGLCCGGMATESTVSAIEATEAVAVTSESPITTGVPDDIQVTETPYIYVTEAAADIQVTEAAPDGACSVCPNGITVDADTETEGENVCGTIQADAARFDAEDNICSRIKSFESTCCPDVDITTTVASIAETASTTAANIAGSTAAISTTVAPVDINGTAASIADFASTTAAGIAGSTAAPGSCVVCPNGITAPLTLQTVPGKTCADLLPDAALHEEGDGICEAIKESEETCCPVGGFVSCSFCAEGLTASGATLLVGDITCDDMVNDAAEIQESSTICSQVKGFEDTCCPSLIATTTEATTTAAAVATTTTAETNWTALAESVSSTITNSPTKAPTTSSEVGTTAPVPDYVLPATVTVTGFNDVYDPSTGFSVSKSYRSSIAIIGISLVYAVVA